MDIFDNNNFNKSYRNICNTLKCLNINKITNGKNIFSKMVEKTLG